GSGAAAESAGELGAFSELPLGLGDLANGIVLLQHPVREYAIYIEVLVAGGVKSSEVLRLPRLTGEPGRDPRFDRAEISADEDVPGGSAERRAGYSADDLKRVAQTRQLCSVAGDQRVDQRGRQLAVITRQVVQLRSDRGPSSRSGANAEPSPPFRTRHSMTSKNGRDFIPKFLVSHGRLSSRATGST